ncbi:clotting factor G beta subunit-like [Harmonia axyridis]|uniref:clotting factor G beta subunit-like n=1 Tax=Harmonia axyridis TaxID=115357 RepID=UPI001E277179|nr:clotting factor G beta subunit-like [Harmonia axyridis]
MFFRIILSAILAICFVNGLEEGEECTLRSTGQQGICKTILSCKAALDEIKHQKFPQTCGFAGSVPRVCCAEGGPPRDITTTTTTERTTTTRKVTLPTRGVTKKPSNVSLVNPYKVNEAGYKTFEKCVEYSKLVVTYKKPPILIIDKQEIKENTCGFRVVPLIVGGELANRREFPHMALVGYDSGDSVEWLCGGSLISENFVLTAGHCLISKEHGNASQVRLGVTEINNPSNRQDRRVIEIIKHPGYSPPSLYYDMGLLRLEKSVKFDIYVRPACLHHSKNPLGERAIATGWGNIEFEGIPSDKLLKVTLGLSDPVTCSEAFIRVSQQKLERGIDDEIMVCAGYTGKDTCQGDSGGPLQIYSPIDCMYEVIGITSFGKACGKGKSPGVYTRVSHFIDWLEKIVFT